jgi:ankyrin repeat protein
MCERELPVDLFPVLAMHLEREDVFALSVSCVSGANGLTATREPLVDWIVDRCVRLHGDSPLTSAVELTSDAGAKLGHREGSPHAIVAHMALQRVLREQHPATCADAVRALCAASARGYERAVDLLLEEGDGAPLSGLAAPLATAPCATAPLATAGRGEALMEAVYAKVLCRASTDTVVPVTRAEAAYRALLQTRSARVAARLLDWAPEVEPEHVHVFCPVFGCVHSLVHCACALRRTDVLREILARRGALAGFRAALLDRDDASRLDAPLHAALRDDDAESPAAVVRALLDAGAWHSPLNVDGKTPLHLAAMRSGCAGAGCVRLLLEAGADPAARDVVGRTPLHLAAPQRRDACCVRALLEAGADPTLRDTYGHTPLHFAHSADAARRLIAAGADPNNDIEQCDDGPLHCAAHLRRPDVARALLAAGADPNLRNVHGRTALHCARDKEVVDLLVEAGARLDARDNTGQTPLERAVANGSRAHNESVRYPEYTQLIEALVTAGAQPFTERQRRQAAESRRPQAS